MTIDIKAARERAIAYRSSASGHSEGDTLADTVQALADECERLRQHIGKQVSADHGPCHREIDRLRAKLAEVTAELDDARAALEETLAVAAGEDRWDPSRRSTHGNQAGRGRAGGYSRLHQHRVLQG